MVAVSIDEIPLPKTMNDAGQNFSSWQDFYRPTLYNGDNFTTVQHYDLKSLLFDTVAVADDEEFATYGSSPRPVNNTQPYAFEKVILLTDSYCSSTCVIFVEMMHFKAGLRSAVIGGRPSYGPMQAVSGTRGAASYSTTTLDRDIELTQKLEVEALNDPAKYTSLTRPLTSRSSTARLRNPLAIRARCRRLPNIMDTPNVV